MRNSSGAAVDAVFAAKMGIVRATVLQARQTADQFLHGQAAMRELVLDRTIQFGRSLAVGRNIEQWVVAEAVGAALGGENFAVPFAFGDDRLRVVGGAHQHQDAGKMGAPVALAGQIGKVFLQADAEGKKTTAKNTTNVIPKAELEKFQAAGQAVTDAWVSDITAKGSNGKQLLDGARALIAKHVSAK